MKTQVVRVSQETHQQLKELSSFTGKSIGDILAKVVEKYRRELLLKETDEAFALLRENKALWERELSERSEWDSTLSDGLDDK